MQMAGSKTWTALPCLLEPQRNMAPHPTFGAGCVERWAAGPCKSIGYSKTGPLRSEMLGVRGAPAHRDGRTAGLATNDGRV